MSAERRANLNRIELEALSSGLHMKLHALLLICAAFTVLACSATGGDDDARILVASASGLAVAIPEMVAAFEAATGTRVDVMLGSSGQIAHTILNGAPVDLFLSADAGWVDRLRQAGRTVPGTEVVYACGPLVLVSTASSPPVRELADLRQPAIHRIAIANPEHAPYGRAARQALERAGIWRHVESRVVIAQNVRQTLQYVETGVVDVAVSARSLVRDDRHVWVPVPATAHDPLRQTLVVIAGRPRKAEAGAFAAFVTGPDGQAILARHGFLSPATSEPSGATAPHDTFKPPATYGIPGADSSSPIYAAPDTSVMPGAAGMP